MSISIARFGSMFRVIVAHDDNDLLALEEAVKDSLRAMRQGGYLA
jgi:hypothetical protein